MIKIAVDAMGSDQGPQMVIESIYRFLKTHQDVTFFVYGKEEEITKFIKPNSNSINIINCSKVVTGDDKNLSMLIRSNPDISMFKAMHDISLYDGFVSAGPTQALVAGTHFIVGRLPGIQRIALAPVLPLLSQSKVLLDAGANVNLTPEQLVKLGLGGLLYYKVLLGKDNPKLGLLNIGTESGKGRELEIETHKLLTANKQINFIGNIEPEFALNGDVDVILADGFAGNIFLKSCEGLYKLFKGFFKNTLYKKIRNKIGLLFLKKDLKKLKSRFSDEQNGGAIILGAKKIVVKCHGGAVSSQFLGALNVCYNTIKKDFIKQYEEALTDEKHF